MLHYGYSSYTPHIIWPGNSIGMNIARLGGSWDRIIFFVLSGFILILIISFFNIIDAQIINN
ncbi:hypothetical protein ACE5D9_01310 [Rickettsia sp. 2024-CO-Wats]|uniref:hypothetical protein n=1 Tax=unclassified Rickettsia TaxID=114295 RepID=UPI00370D68A8